MAQQEQDTRQQLQQVRNDVAALAMGQQAWQQKQAELMQWNAQAAQQQAAAMGVADAKMTNAEEFTEPTGGLRR